MLTVKDLQSLNEILVQEELLQAKTKNLYEMAEDKKIAAMLKEINKQSLTNHKEVLTFLETNKK
ncbi:MAG: hypothetical protein FWE38_02470 [Firmicutes bacterium]|nr:hypothetical protein [Bacillota bacterium]